MDSHENIAVGGAPGSGRFGYPQGTNNDDRIMTRRRQQQGSTAAGSTPGPIIIELPFVSRSCGTCLTAGRGNFLALSLGEELEHFKERHPGTSIIYKCSRCGKEYQRKHPAECHIPKCPGPPVVEVLPFQCTVCPRTFGTQIGLSQHERHEHPQVRNVARAATAGSSGSTTNRHRAFSEEEILRMLEMEVRFRGDRTISKKMAEELGTKTAKQVRDKRREAAYLRRRAELFSTPEEEQPIQDEPAPPREPSLIPPLEESIEGVTAWRSSIRDNIMEANLPENTRDNDLIALVGRLKETATSACEAAGLISQDTLDAVYEEVVSFLLPSAPTEVGRRRPRGSSPGRPRSHTNSRRSRRQFEYARTQELYRENPGLLAKYMRSGYDWLRGGDSAGNIPAEIIKQYYEDLWGETPNVQLQRVEREELIPLASIFAPFTSKEIDKRVTRMKQNVAAGTDGIKRNDLKKRSVPVVLQILFNYIMLSGIQPTAWRANRTTLLLKEGKDAAQVKNYRPITIGSILSRLYWGLIDERLRQCVSVTPRQKGFTSESGCFNNVHILNEIIKASKSQEGLVAVQLDITKAFDTIPHKAIEWALCRKGLPGFAVRHIVDSYRDMHTVIKHGSSTATIKLNRGVKQGDPLSPLIFNLVFEPLLLELQNMSGFKVSETTQVSSLAFADDLMLTASTKDDAAKLLRCTESFLKGLGMNLAAEKCACFQIKKTKDSWCLVNPDLALIGGASIPYADEESRLEYLGMQISPWAGLNLADIKDALYTSCQRIKKLPLKPHQKLSLIAKYTVPHYLYPLVIAVPPITLVREIDQELRVVYKEILHLPQSTADGLLYCAKRDGGLGLPKMEIIVASSTLKTGLKFIQSQDPVQQALAVTSGMISRLKRVANAVRINWPITSVKEVDSYKKRAKKEELSRWAQLRSQGKAVPSLTEDKIGNAWLYNPALLKPCRFITALKMRANVAGDKVSLRRAGIANNVECRQCQGQLETLAHILGQCTFTKPARIKRHNEIRDLILDEAVRRNPNIAASKEPTLRLPSGEALKPDLVLQNQTRVLVVDITVRHEDEDYLERGRLEKVRKYTPLLPTLQQRFQKEDAEVLPIVVGTRGAMPKETIRALEKINISDRKTLKTISLMALRSSIEIYHHFMDYNVPRRVNAAQLQ